MKETLYILIICLFSYDALSQGLTETDRAIMRHGGLDNVVITKEPVKLYISVRSKENKKLRIDTLCSGFDSLTGFPIDLVIPNGGEILLSDESIDNSLLYTHNDILQAADGEMIFKLGIAIVYQGNIRRTKQATESFKFINPATRDTVLFSWEERASKLNMSALVPYEKSLRLLDKILLDSNFFRTHQSHLVNLISS